MYWAITKIVRKKTISPASKNMEAFILTQSTVKVVHEFVYTKCYTAIQGTRFLTLHRKIPTPPHPQHVQLHYQCMPTLFAHCVEIIYQDTKRDCKRFKKKKTRFQTLIHYCNCNGLNPPRKKTNPLFCKTLSPMIKHQNMKGPTIKKKYETNQQTSCKNIL